MKDFLRYTYDKNLAILDDASSGLGAVSIEEIYRLTYNTLHSAVDNLDRLDKTLLSQEEIGVIDGIRYANNGLKHRKDMICIQEKRDGATFPQKVDGTGRFFHYVWSDVSKLGSSPDKMNKQKEQYMSFIQGESVVYVFEVIS